MFKQTKLVSLATLVLLLVQNAWAVESVTFRQEPAEVGDRVAQIINTSLDLTTSIKQADQLANQSTNAVKRNQNRFIEVMETDNGRIRQAHVSFPVSKISSSESQNPEEEITQAVEGKSYLVTRQDKKLLVVDYEGNIPPLNEYEVVVTSLQTLGLPSPLAKFLLGRTIQVGERLEVPPAVAAEMMGFDANVGQVQNFEFLLQEIRLVDEQPCAVFKATIVASGDKAEPIQMRVEGEVVIQTETCRTISAKLNGPLTLTTHEQTSQGNFEYSANGQMQVAIRSHYGHAKK